MGYIVALDIGIASVGWAVIDKETELVLEAGSNIFPEATAAENLTRRQMRQGRRLKRRQRTRLNDFNKLWARKGFTIPENNVIDIVGLKVKGLNNQLSMDELYLVLYSYLKHRGISYLEDAEDDSNAGNSAYARGLSLNEKELKTKYPCEIQKERLEKIGKYRGQSMICEDGEQIDISNVFTIGAYRKEITKLLETQRSYYSKLDDEFIDAFMFIFNRKRKYYEGPGNEKSRTDYGIYTTKIGEDGEYITDDNIFAKLIGKCSVYPDQLRAAAASYTAQEFNLLNDLNNLTVNGIKLSEEEKRTIVDLIKNTKTTNVRKFIEQATGEKIESLSGARIDKDDKELLNDNFKAYNKMKKSLEEIGVDIESFSREELDEIGHILTINTDKEAILEAFKSSTFTFSDEIVECFIGIRKKNGSLFSKWHSFSLKIMNELIPEMYSQPKEQMALLTDMGVFRGKSFEFEGLKYIPVDAASEEIYNPVAKRAIRISFRILNAVMKKYGSPSDVVIEMPRDKNSDEEKKFITESQKKNEKEMTLIEKYLAVNYDLKLTKAHYGAQKQLSLKLKLWNEQDKKCIYSGKTIEAEDIIKNPDMFEIDHIIPRSISFDDSRANKVLVYRTENQNKGNQTPYYYFTHSSEAKRNFEEFKADVIALSRKKDYGFSRKKVKNLLFMEDITKQDVLRGFINRNINDTRYASKVVLNTLQSFFAAKDEDTKVKVINGSYTHQMRVNLRLDKNREESYSHHAVDAMLIAYSKLGYDAYRKLQGEFIDFETGELLKPEMWDENMSDDVYQEYLYGRKWSAIRNAITDAEKKVKYWYYVDKKSNRGLCNQTIRGTREYGGKIYKINKLDIRNKVDVKTFKNLALNKKESERERLLVYKNDRKTFDQLLQILNDYSEIENPFTQYEKETGDFVRKYAKHGDGPRIDKLKYTNGEVGSCIDISHKYGHEKGSKKVFLESLVPYRMDVYYKPAEEAYYLFGLKQSDVKCVGGKYVIDEEAYAVTLRNEKMISDGQSRAHLDSLGYEFKMSFYKNDIIEYEKNGETFVERFLSRTKPKQRNYIETKPINKDKFEGRNQVGLGKTTHIRKYRMDILGNYYPCEKEEFTIYC